MDGLSGTAEQVFRSRKDTTKTLHIRKATKPDPPLQKIYDILNISATPGGVQKLII